MCENIFAGFSHKYLPLDCFLIQPALNSNANIFFLIEGETAKSSSGCPNGLELANFEKNRAYALCPYGGTSKYIVTYWVTTYI